MEPVKLGDIFDSCVEMEQYRMLLCPCEDDGSHASCNKTASYYYYYYYYYYFSEATEQ